VEDERVDFGVLFYRRPNSLNSLCELFWLCFLYFETPASYPAATVQVGLLGSPKHVLVLQEVSAGVDDGGSGGGGQLGKNILMLTNLRRSATYTCVASSDLGNIAYDVDVIVKGIFTRHQRRVQHTHRRCMLTAF